MTYQQHATLITDTGHIVRMTSCAALRRAKGQVKITALSEPRAAYIQESHTVAGLVYDPLFLPDEVWRTSPIWRMLRCRDFRSIFNLVRLNGISPLKLAILTGLTEDFVRDVMDGDAAVTSVEQVERIANGLRMPAPARAALGLAECSSDPSHMPAEFWERPDLVQALTIWDVPAALAAIVKERQWNQHQLAEILGYSQSWVSNVMRRTQSLTVDQARAIFVQFGAPLHGFASLFLRDSIGKEEAVDGAITAAAQEADTELVFLNAHIDPATMDWLWQESLQAAKSGNRAPCETFIAARRVRRLALQMTERTKHPGTLSDIYVVSSQATALMASTAFDLNRWDASAALARSAYSYASLAGHSSLQTWTLGLTALLANWRGEPKVALSQIRRAMPLAPHGTPKVRLRYIACRSYALLGDGPSVEDELRKAREEQQDAGQHYDSLSDEVSGEFAFAPARAEACAAAAWLDLGRGVEALDCAERALTEIARLPAGQQPASQVSGTRIDLAAACLLDNDLDRADEAVRPVLALPLSLRNVSLCARMTKMRSALSSSRWAKDAQARQLCDDVGSWLAKDAHVRGSV